MQGKALIPVPVSGGEESGLQGGLEQTQTEHSRQSTCGKLSPTGAVGIEGDLRLHVRIRGLLAPAFQEEGRTRTNI